MRFSFNTLIRTAAFVTFMMVSKIKAMATGGNGNNNGGITYISGYQAPQPGGEDQIRLLTFVGEQSEYILQAGEWSRYALSDAICGENQYRSMATYTLQGPCSTSVSYHNQYFTAICQNDSNSYADIYFSPAPGSGAAFGEIQYGETALIITYGNIYAGFDTNQDDLKQGVMNTTDANAGSVVSCYGPNRD